MFIIKFECKLKHSLISAVSIVGEEVGITLGEVLRLGWLLGTELDLRLGPAVGITLGKKLGTTLGKTLETTLGLELGVKLGLELG